MTKVALVDTDGNEFAVELAPNVMLLPHPGWTERDAEAMWRAACTSIRTLLERTGVAPGDILAVAPTGYGGGGYFVDAQGLPTRNGIVSTDTRTLPLLAEWNRTGTGAKLRSAIGQQTWGGQTLGLMAWIDRNEPEVAARTRHVLGCKDFLRLRLCGDISTDSSDAGCAGLLSVARGGYSLEVLQLAGIAHWAEKLPPLGPCTEVVGQVSDKAAAQTGLAAGTPVVRGVYDVVGCALATGVTRTDQLAAVAGTFAIHSTLHQEPCLDPLPTIQTPYPVDGLVMATMATPTSASNLEWLRRTMLAAEIAEAEAQGRSLYDLIHDKIAATLGQPNDILFAPFIFGGPEGAPAGLVGLRADSGMADILRAVFEGVVFSHRSDMDYLLSGRQSAQVGVIRLAGGAAKSPLWSQMFADGLRLPVELTEGNELGIKGAALCSAVALGLAPDMKTAIARMVRQGPSRTPDPRRLSVLDTKYAAYRQFVSLLVQLGIAPEEERPAQDA
ncbi:carbohydrate kinase [Rhodobacteraceae bacterium CYK-10]|uniref:Carbohydrate kinase n=2 Tax=Stagnihabitans tardus TaxID=2699202 RepID=A0AAE4YB85_9RHOB|nr:carbohydrate kinase [Stagnihabitans tardus]